MASLIINTSLDIVLALQQAREGLHLERIRQTIRHDAPKARSPDLILAHPLLSRIPDTPLCSWSVPSKTEARCSMSNWVRQHNTGDRCKRVKGQSVPAARCDWVSWTVDLWIQGWT